MKLKKKIQLLTRTQKIPSPLPQAPPALGTARKEKLAQKVHSFYRWLFCTQEMRKVHRTNQLCYISQDANKMNGYFCNVLLAGVQSDFMHFLRNNFKRHWNILLALTGGEMTFFWQSFAWGKPICLTPASDEALPATGWS